MSIARVKTWVAGEVLLASDLNGEFNNVLSNPVDLWSPAGKAADMNGFEFIMDADADSSFTADTDDRLDVRLSGVDLFRFNGTVTTPVNGYDFIGSATGVAPSLTCQGSDTNISLTVAGKGTGRVALGQATSTDVQLVADQPIVDSSGNEYFKFSKTASAVNEVTVTNAATANAPSLSATGGDTNIDLNLVTKGSGVLKTNGNVIKQLVKDHGTKSGNYTLQLDEANEHLVAFSALATLTIASTNTNDRALVIVKNGGFVITISGIDTDSPTLTNGASKQDFLGIVKSFGKITCVSAVLNKATT